MTEKIELKELGEYHDSYSDCMERIWEWGNLLVRLCDAEKDNDQQTIHVLLSDWKERWTNAGKVCKFCGGQFTPQFPIECDGECGAF